MFLQGVFQTVRPIRIPSFEQTAMQLGTPVVAF